MGLAVYSSQVLQRDVYVIYCTILGVTCSAWLLMRRRIAIGIANARQSRSFVLALGTLFFLALLASVLALYFRPEQFVRPLYQFVIASLMTGAVALEVIYLPPGRRYLAFVIAQVLTLGFTIQFSQALLFPDVVGVDPALHFNLVGGIIYNGQITPGNDYSTTPLFHLQIAMGVLLGDLSYKDATVLFVTLPEVVLPALSVYLLGRYLFSARVGLMAALLLTMAPYHIYFGIWAVPNTFASLSIPLIVYLLFKLRREKQPGPSGPYQRDTVFLFGTIVLLLVALVMTHPVASMGMAMVLLIGWLINGSYMQMVSKKAVAPVTIGMVLFFITLMVGWWTYIGDQIEYLGNQLFTGFQISYLTSVPSSVSMFVYTIPLLEQLLRYLGMFAFFSVAILGCFFMVSKRLRNLDRTILVFIGLIPCGVGFFALAFALSGLDARWFLLAEMLLAVPAAIIVLGLHASIKPKALASMLVVLMVTSLAFLAIISPSGSMDNRELFPNTGVRYAFVESELTGASFLAGVTDGPISSDFDYATDVSSSVFLNYYGVDPFRLVSLDHELLNRSFKPDGSMKVIRAEIAEGPIRVFALPYHLGYDPEAVLAPSNFSKVYDNQGVSAFV